jgi:hypothetical protein
MSDVWSHFDCSLVESRSLTESSLFDEDSSNTQLAALLIFQELVYCDAKSLPQRRLARLQLLCRIRQRYSRLLQHTTVVHSALRRTPGSTGRHSGPGMVDAEQLLGHGPQSSSDGGTTEAEAGRSGHFKCRLIYVLGFSEMIQKCIKNISSNYLDSPYFCLSASCTHNTFIICPWNWRV